MRPSLIALVSAAAVLAGAAHAQAPAPAAPTAPAAPAAPTYSAYGPNITLEQALQVVAAANAEAAKRKLPATIAIVDTSGALIYYQRATNAPGTAEAFATRKAVAAVKERHATSADQQRLAANPGATPFLPDFFPFGGGQPIVVDGKVIGAIGETGGADDDVAKAGAAALH
jgi:uncharacterized protein GlcG (DUF336 family)